MPTGRRNGWRGIRRMRRLVLALSCVAAAVPVPSQAEDSTRSAPAPGLRVADGAAAALLLEKLDLSTHEIRTSYRLHRAGRGQIQARLAFRLPDIDLAEDGGAGLSQPYPDPVNFLGYWARIEGEPVSAEVRQLALLGGAERAHLLRSAGVPISVFDPSFLQRLAALETSDRAQLSEEGLAEAGVLGGTRPLWTMRTEFFWEISSVGEKPVRIEQGYRPLIGRSLLTLEAVEVSDADGPHWLEAFCLEGRRLSDLRSMIRDRGPLVARRLDYALAAETRLGSAVRITLAVNPGAVLVAGCAIASATEIAGAFTIDPARLERDRHISFLVVTPE